MQKQGYAKRSAQAYEPGLPDSLTLEFRAAILQVRSELNLFGNPGVDKSLFTEIWIMDNIEEADPSTRGGAVPLSPARNQPATDSPSAGGSSTGSGPDSSSSKSGESAASVAAGAPAPGSPMRQTPPQRQNNPDIQPGSQ